MDKIVKLNFYSAMVGIITLTLAPLVSVKLFKSLLILVALQVVLALASIYAGFKENL